MAEQISAQSVIRFQKSSPEFFQEAKRQDAYRNTSSYLKEDNRSRLAPLIVFSPLLFLGAPGVASYLAINALACGSDGIVKKENGDGGGANQDGGGADASTMPSCKPGDFQPCGPCDLGLEQCGGDYTWHNMCEGITQALLDAPQACYDGEVGTQGLGECQEGSKKCVYDSNASTWSWGVCEGEVVSREESCNSKDDDCDGLTDEDENDQEPWVKEIYSGPEGTPGNGPCRVEKRTCSEGSWRTDIGEVTPVSETCDLVDNDCDGQTDEGLKNACGVCGPLPQEVCNGRDDDCDGQVDEGNYSECGGCGCSAGHCLAPSCSGDDSCGDSDGCGGMCQTCPPGKTCSNDSQCVDAPLDCAVAGRFYFGNDNTSHGYTVSGSGATHPQARGNVSCGPAIGIGFTGCSQWIQIAFPVPANSDVLKLSTYSYFGLVSVTADGFDCESDCFLERGCGRKTLEWEMADYPYSIAADGSVSLLFTSMCDGTLSRGDISYVELETCDYRDGR